jgi:hypothetical protein
MGNETRQDSGQHDLSDLAALHLTRDATFSERRKKAFDLATEVTKQLLTLSTAVLTVVVTVYRDVLKSPTSIAVLIVYGLIAMIVSIAFGAWALMAITGALSSKHIATPDLTINRFSIRLPAIGQVVFFVIALGLFVAFASRSSGISLLLKAGRVTLTGSSGTSQTRDSSSCGVRVVRRAPNTSREMATAT